MPLTLNLWTVDLDSRIDQSDFRRKTAEVDASGRYGPAEQYYYILERSN